MPGANDQELYNIYYDWDWTFSKTQSIHNWTHDISSLNWQIQGVWSQFMGQIKNINHSKQQVHIDG